jgi:hypothetical protein
MGKRQCHGGAHEKPDHELAQMKTNEHKHNFKGFTTGRKGSIRNSPNAGYA